MLTWTRLDDGTWGVRWPDSPYPQGTATGFAVTVSSASGRKRRVVLGEHVRTLRVKGGRFIDIYRASGI